MVYRVYAHKKPAFAVEANALAAELRGLLGMGGLTSLTILNRYDVEGIDEALFHTCVPLVFSEPPVDEVLYTLPAAAHRFAVEYLPGQFDQRADSASECIQLISQGERPLVRSARVYLLEGALSGEDCARIEQYVVNPVEARLADLGEKQTLKTQYPPAPAVPVLTGFAQMDAVALAAMVGEYGLAMDEEDLAFCQRYFKEEGRAPTLTELRMIDTYWSDHCRHTTFGTVLTEVHIEDETVRRSYDAYLALRGEVYGPAPQKPQTLMDMGTIGAKALKKRGVLQHLDESDEINACSVEIKVDNGGKEEDWLLLFKNETHNHPTEIEPFGGAATCIGGAIRDPLANRGYVYGAMRVTGAANPLAPVADTLPGKLPQRKLVTGAAAGYSSYGNQIGLATGQVHEFYHPGYVAKRMEIGAVLGAVPQQNVRREVPAPGDVVILLGGRTGRDGIGGATGSSKAHKAESVEQCGAEVQKGNAPVERKLQRLFRNPAATRLIRRCNDFGAGGVSVAIGELADGLRIDLDAIPKKYEGLSGTELAISESQERMAVVVAEADGERFIRLAEAENLEATPVAVVTEAPRLVMTWQGDVVVDVARAFLNSNGAEKRAQATVPPLPAPTLETPRGATLEQKLTAHMQSLAHCSQKGLAERFDATIGAGSLLMPFGGKYQLTSAQALAMKLPVEGETTTASGMAFGFDPYIAQQNPYAGAYLAVVESVAKLVATGFAAQNAYLTFQEYFERLGAESTRWGKPVASLLGALQAQLDLGVAAIGGKDSMSGSFETLDVPPTLVSFAVAAGKTYHVTSPEIKLPGSRVAWLRPARQTAPGGGEGLLPEPESLKTLFAAVQSLIQSGAVLAVCAVGSRGVAEALFQMCLGNRLGFAFAGGTERLDLFAPGTGGFLVELADETTPLPPGSLLLGETGACYTWRRGAETVDLAAVQQAWEAKLEPVLPYRTPQNTAAVEPITYTLPENKRAAPKMGAAKPRALVPVFPGTNCEYDTARALRRAGAEADIFIVRNLTPEAVAESAVELAKRIRQSQMVVLPGGFSGGDEPEGSAKLIASFFRGPAVAEAVAELLDVRDGLMLGICNGFQALVKLGLLPHGAISPVTAESPTLTFNTIGRHQSMLARTRIASNLSPWLALEPPGAVHAIAMSHGEGRFTAPEEVLHALREKGQIAAQYVDLEGNPTMDVRYNPNGSAWAIEAITSEDGRILGKMGHTERAGQHVHKNVPGEKFQKLFEGGVAYYKVL